VRASGNFGDGNVSLAHSFCASVFFGSPETSLGGDDHGESSKHNDPA
jgi:hypothetical protein